jgi:uncharacterized membrane protein YgdD (TMEM256/DUF423 family)
MTNDQHGSFVAGHSSFAGFSRVILTGMDRLFVMLGAIVMFLGVGAGAFGAHGLSAHFVKFPHLEATYATAVRYHMIHGLALLLVGLLAARWPGVWLNWSGYLLLAGIVIFSGSLYLLSLTGVRWLGAITPLGGVAFLAGWICLFVAVWKGG